MGAIVSVFDDNLFNMKSWDSYLNGIDVVFNLAAETDLIKAELNPTRNYRVNVKPVLDMCRCKVFTGKLIQAGAATQTGWTGDGTKVGLHKVDQPITIYDLHKLMAEQYAVYYKHCCLRLTTVYGPGKFRNDNNRNVVNKSIINAIEDKEITILNGGKQIRDFIYISDVIDAFLCAGRDNLEGAYLVGTGKGTTFRQMANFVADFIGATVLDVEIKLAKIHTRSFVADFFAFEAATGWTARVGIDEGVNRTLRYFNKEI